MSEKRQEKGRATVEVEGRVYTLLVYWQTYDEWDDPERHVEERYAAFGPGREVPDDIDAETWLRSSFDGIGSEVYDGGGRDRRHQEATAETKAKRKAEKAERRAKITDDTTRVEYRLCPECGEAAHSEDFEERAYECSQDGWTGRGEDGRRCETCNRFTAKVADLSCPSCEAALEELGEAVVGVEVDGYFVREEEL